jgi:hypothetical protein
MPAEPVESSMPQDKIDLLKKASDDSSAAFEALEQILRDKILFGLTVYPALSPSMLHVFLGTATPKALWKDIVLEKLLLEGVVTKTEATLTSPYDRTQTYTVLHLTSNLYTPPADANQTPDIEQDTSKD